MSKAKSWQHVKPKKVRKDKRYGEGEGELEEAYGYLPNLARADSAEELTEEEELEEAYGYLPNLARADSEEELTEEEELEKAYGYLQNLTEKEEVLPAKADSGHSQNVGKMENSCELADNNPKVYMYVKKVFALYRLRYVHDPEMGEPLSIDNGRYWEPLTDGRLRVLIYGLLREEDKRQIENSPLFCNNVVAFIKLECAKRYYDGERFRDKDFKAVKNHAVFRNGVYDAQNGLFLPFNTNLPYTFGLNADYLEEDVETEAWDKLRFDASGDRASMDMLEHWIGYLEVPNMSAKALAIMASAKDSGKSVCGQFTAEMYEGGRAEAVDPDKLSGRFAYAKAATTLLLYCFDLNTSQLKSVDVAELKKITGEKMIRSEAKYQTAVTMPIRFKVMLATNTGLFLGKGEDDGGAFYRRVIVLPFIKSRESGEMMDDLLDRLRAERSAILSKCIRKFGEIIRPDGGITFPESELSKSIKESWRSRLDMVKMFMESMLDVTGNMNDVIIKEEIYSEYKRFALEKADDMDMRGFPILLKTACITRIIELAGGKVAQSKIRVDNVRADSNTKCFPSQQKPCLRGIRWKAVFFSDARIKNEAQKGLDA